MTDAARGAPAPRPAPRRRCRRRRRRPRRRSPAAPTVPPPSPRPRRDQLELGRLCGPSERREVPRRQRHVDRRGPSTAARRPAARTRPTGSGSAGSARARRRSSRSAPTLTARARGGGDYVAWYELVPQAAVNIRSLTIRAGDRMSATVNVRGHTVKLRLANLTTGKTFRKKLSASQVDVSSAEYRRGALAVRRPGPDLRDPGAGRLRHGDVRQREGDDGRRPHRDDRRPRLVGLGDLAHPGPRPGLHALRHRTRARAAQRRPTSRRPATPSR